MAIEVEETDLLPPIVHLSQEEASTFFDRSVREYLGMSAEEFVRRWDSGEYDEIADEPAHWDVLYLAMLGGLDR